MNSVVPIEKIKDWQPKFVLSLKLKDFNIIKFLFFLIHIYLFNYLFIFRLKNCVTEILSFMVFKYSTKYKYFGIEKYFI